jgi:hypothetical protein
MGYGISPIKTQNPCTAIRTAKGRARQLVRRAPTPKQVSVLKRSKKPPAKKKKAKETPTQASSQEALHKFVSEEDSAVEKFRAEAEREFLAWKTAADQDVGRNGFTPILSDPPANERQQVVPVPEVKDENEDDDMRDVRDVTQGQECWHCPVENCKKIYPLSQVEEREMHLALHNQILELENRVKRAIERRAIIDLGFNGEGDDDFCDSSVEDTYYTGAR